MKTDKEIIFSLEDYTAYIKINRPPHNFFDTKLISQIADILEAMDKEKQCRSIILFSEGKNFCAGADFSKSNFTNEENIYEDLYKQAIRLFRTNKPIIALIQGAAIGGGLGVALSADFRVTCKEARFSANFGKLGFHQGFGTTITLPRVVGNQKAKLMLLTSKRISGDEAYNMGLVDYLVERSELMNKAQELSNEINSSGPLGIKSIRKTLNKGLAEEIEKIVKLEAREQNILRDTKDFKEGINASINRRQPMFKEE
jgi:2-(1,2-epoxy-1,2-dihydrophenyl)acetyl-CoA isomerase